MRHRKCRVSQVGSTRPTNCVPNSFQIKPGPRCSVASADHRTSPIPTADQSSDFVLTKSRDRRSGQASLRDPTTKTGLPTARTLRIRPGRRRSFGCGTENVGSRKWARPDLRTACPIRFRSSRIPDALWHRQITERLRSQRPISHRISCSPRAVIVGRVKPPCATRQPRPVCQPRAPSASGRGDEGVSDAAPKMSGLASGLDPTYELRAQFVSDQAGSQMLCGIGRSPNVSDPNGRSVIGFRAHQEP